MVQIIVNRYSQTNIINPQMIQKNFNRAIFAAVPEDVGTCDGSLAKSTPLCIAAPNTPIARSYHDIVRKVQQSNLLETPRQAQEAYGRRGQGSDCGERSGRR